MLKKERRKVLGNIILFALQIYKTNKKEEVFRQSNRFASSFLQLNDNFLICAVEYIIATRDILTEFLKLCPSIVYIELV